MKKTVLFLLYATLNAAVAQNYSFNYSTNGARVCLVEAEVDLTTPSVKIKLLDALSNTGNATKIFRRPLYGPGTAWVLVAPSLPAGTAQWVDVNVHAGEVWEYQVKRTGTWSYNSQTYDATGYTVGSLLKDNAGYRGQMILLVADNIASGLATKYTRLKKELTGEGWFVKEIIVPKANGWYSGDTVVGIRNLVATIYNTAPATDKPKALFILGHVPMPRSGSTSVTAPDGHNQNMGARGCDGYYADIDGMYTDTATFNPGGLQTPLAVNLPGDFKWDRDFFPSALEMAFGRVDFRDIINTSLTELQLTENYLDRLSSYKTVTTGFNMGNKTGFALGYDNSNDGSYRTLPDISKSANVYQNTVGAPHPQWVQSNGPFKIYMQNSNFPDVTEWTTYGMNATVYTSDQSYWGFNDVPQDYYYSRIRALLAVPNTNCLVTLWTTSAVNSFHQACMGDPLGFGVKETMNHNTVNNNIEKPQQMWDASDWWNRTHLTYNGDPTLRLYQLAPASNLAAANHSNTAVLSWTASPDTATTGYHIYKSTSEFGIYTRLTATPVSTTTYTDLTYQSSCWYMVRAVKTEESGCGKFINPGMGIFLFANLDLTASINENTLPGTLNVFPNPASREVTVNAEYIIGSLQLIGSDGRTVVQLDKLNRKTMTLDVSSLPTGTYILKIDSREKSETRKLIVK